MDIQTNSKLEGKTFLQNVYGEDSLAQIFGHNVPYYLCENKKFLFWNIIE
jgi:hypothetical protein